MNVVVAGQTFRLLDTWEAAGWVVDTWETLADDPGNLYGSGVVFTVRDWAQVMAEPFIPWGGVYGYAVVAQPESDAQGRFLEAVRQAQVRQVERLWGGPSEQVAP